MTAPEMGRLESIWDDQDLENRLQFVHLHGIDYRTSRELLDLAGLSQDSEVLIPLLLSLFLALNEGSLCLELEEEKLKKRLELFGEFGSRPGTAGEILEGIRTGRWKELIGTQPETFLPLRIHREGQQEFLYFQKYDSIEKQLAEDFQALVSAPNQQKPVERLREVIVETLEENPTRNDSGPVELNLQQKIGLCLSLLKNVVIISGGPGTGKTSIVVALLRALTRLGVPSKRIRLAAPTGRAANRLSESIHSALDSIQALDATDENLKRLKGMTLHRLLRYRGNSDSFWYHRYNPIPADLIVVDEVSMVDISLMADLVSAIRPGTRLVLLGDKDQLPSVEAGAVLGNLVPEIASTLLSGEGKNLIEELLGVRLDSLQIVDKDRMADRVVVLEKSYRSEASILSFAGRINSGDSGVVSELKDHRLPVGERSQGPLIDWPVPPVKDGGVCWIDSSGVAPKHWEKVLDSWIDRQFLTSEEGVRRFMALVHRPVPNKIEEDKETQSRLRELFDWLDRSRILGLVRKGIHGVEWINRHVGRRMREHLAAGVRGELFAGLPILILRNDLELGVFNGDVGVLLLGEDRTLRAYFGRGNSFVSHPIASLPNFEPAYAITVHKSQGSEYGQVLLVLPEDPEHRLLTREIVYTGLTRAKHLAVIYGKGDCLSAAVARKIERDSGRNLWG